MRLLAILVISFWCLACSRSNKEKQASGSAESVHQGVVAETARSEPVRQKMYTPRRSTVFTLDQPADLRLASLHDTIFLEHLQYQDTSAFGTGKFVPLMRSFRVSGYQLDAAANDSVWLIIEDLKTLRRGGQASTSSEGNLFVVQKGTVVAADMDAPNVEEDSSLTWEVYRQILNPKLGRSRSLVAIGKNTSGDMSGRTFVKAYGLNALGAFVEYPGLTIVDAKELPDTLHDQQTLATGHRHGCVFFDVLIRFDSASCSFKPVAQDSGYSARAEVQRYAFDERGDTIIVTVNSRPMEYSEQKHYPVTKSDTLRVTRLIWGTKQVWMLLCKNGTVLGWFDDTMNQELGLNACD